MNYSLFGNENTNSPIRQNYKLRITFSNKYLIDNVTISI